MVGCCQTTTLAKQPIRAELSNVIVKKLKYLPSDHTTAKPLTKIALC